MMKFIRGKKTYIVAVMMALAAGLKALGILDPVMYEALMGMLAALGFGALRAGVEKAAAEVQVVKPYVKGI
jgi:hypothetical protein